VTHNSADAETLERVKKVRAEAVEHTRRARELHEERRGLMPPLVGEGWSQADIARELGVSRQAVQKMLTG
jgi:DNA-directed RNA polymerase specialized sigma24 family protein